MSIPAPPKAPRRRCEDDGSGVRLYQSIYETALRNNVPNSGDRGDDPHLFLRCGFPAQGTGRRLVRHPLLGRREQRGAQRGALRLADARRRNQAVLSLSDGRRRHVRLLRRDRQEREEVPGAQAGRDRHHALGLRRAKSPAAALYEDRIPASIGRRRSARRSSPPATAPSTRSASKAATANMSASAIPTAIRPPTAT